MDLSYLCVFWGESGAVYKTFVQAFVCLCDVLQKMSMVAKNSINAEIRRFSECIARTIALWKMFLLAMS